MKKKKLRKIKRYSPTWEKLANQVARDFAPSIYPCAKCEYPVAKGYCCTFCGTSNPNSKED